MFLSRIAGAVPLDSMYMTWIARTRGSTWTSKGPVEVLREESLELFIEEPRRCRRLKPWSCVRKHGWALWSGRYGLCPWKIDSEERWGVRREQCSGSRSCSSSRGLPNASIHSFGSVLHGTSLLELMMMNVILPCWLCEVACKAWSLRGRIPQYVCLPKAADQSRGECRHGVFKKFFGAKRAKRLL